MTLQIHSFLALQSSRSSCSFDPLGLVGLVGPVGPVMASYSAGPYLRVFGPVSEWNVLLPRLGLSGTCSHASVSKGDAIAGVSAKASNHSSLGCSGMASDVRAVTVLVIYKRVLLHGVPLLYHI